MRRLLISIVVIAAVLGGATAWWLNQNLSLNADTVELSVEPGTSVRAVAQLVSDAGVQVNPSLLYWWFRLSGQSRQIKAGSYEIEAGASPRSLLRKLVRGEEALRAVTLVEGWNFNQVRAALAKAEQLTPDSKGLPDYLIMKVLGRPGLPAEGRFFPDTYTYAKGSSDLAVLKRAMRAMDKALAAAWQQRASETPLQSAEQALILASIVEKETGRSSDRPMIAGVFTNRLRIGMMLQTDPSVIYGLGEAFDGNLRRRDLQTDTPWNTYTRAGLPATPIAMPGKPALLAAVQPAATKALYFVARGDGSSQFSASLEEHNRAVNKYQRGQ
ncbi:MAG: endolytic transglycosylase MltG [Rhodoferax sp.]|uniref:endolytic transglycosylase MltG n=1 Tax=Rhodoferax sp. TaxID=50421 RepID=UPI00262AD2D1|nr:endolytic transglycosylase MltG [Rhodoferax sp.]MDD5336140.1 endolytic transglycosylase MltG [Rhodoferax sp.]